MGDVDTDSPIVSGMFQAVPLPHQSGLRPASFPGGEAFVPGFGVLRFIGHGFRPFRCGTAYVPFRCVANITCANKLEPPTDYVIPRPQ